MGQIERALPYFRKIQDLDVGMRDYILYFLGKGLLERKQCKEAREVFQELAEKYPESRWADLSEAQIRASEPCPPLVPTRPGEEKISCDNLPTRPEQADCFFDSRDYPRARVLYRDLIDEGVAGSRQKSHLVFYLRRLSQAAARSQDYESALWANQSLVDLAPKTESIVSEALRKIASLYQDKGDYENAIPVFKRLLAISNSPTEGSHSWERIGWCYFRLGNYLKAIQSFDAGLAEAESPFLLYWKGRGLERLGKEREAQDLFKTLTQIDGGNYYGLRALEKLRKSTSVRYALLQTWWSGNIHGIHWTKKEVSLDFIRDLERIYELDSIGFIDDAMIEVRRARARLKIPLPNDPRRIRKKEGSFVFGTRILREEHPDYPLPYADFLFSEMKQLKSKLDPFLLYGMMRQESRFRELAVSPAGARGLLQILPATGQKVAREAGWQEYRADWLEEPLTNIELAVKYVKKISDLFNKKGGQWYAIIASYNAGEQVVKGWLRQRKGLSEEEFIEEIPYQETRDYVKKVYTNWKAYRFIYGAD